MSVSKRRDLGFSMLVVLDVAMVVLVLGSVMHTQMAAALGAVEPAVRFQDEFWAARIGELCEGRDQLPRLPAGRAGDPISQVAALTNLRSPIEAVWAQYTKCLEPVTVVIEEDLLHFTTNRHDAFDDPPRRGYATILRYVDKYLTTHSEVYVVGHTDERFTDEYNNLLSYRRALHVTGIIDSSLAARGFVRRTHYNIYPVGRGETALLERRAGEDDESWWKRCRRIEISFRSGGRPGQRTTPAS